MWPLLMITEGIIIYCGEGELICQLVNLTMGLSCDWREGLLLHRGRRREHGGGQERMRSTGGENVSIFAFLNIKA